MIEAIITWIVILALIIAIFLWRKKKKKKAKIDYSFGLQKAREAKQLLTKKQYEEAEKLILNLNSDDLTQTLDYIGLSFDSVQLEDWLKNSKNSNVPKLCLGIFYNHQAWLSRSHVYAKDVSEKGAREFFEFQAKSLELLLSIDHSFSLIGETYSRLIRVYMGEGESDKVHEYFNKAISVDKEMIWPYIHYAEAIQPKWGGNLNLTNDFIKQTPDIPIIKHIVELKLITDSFTVSQNYFGNSEEELKQKAKTALVEIDESVTKNPPSSIHRYIIFNYLMALSEILNDEHLKSKYLKKINGYYTLYPYGIIK